MNDDVSGYPGAPPGWYADPAGGPGQRWWDGYAWTEATVLPATPPPPPPSYSQPHHAAPAQPPLPPTAYPRLTPPPNAAALVTREVALTPLVRVAVIFFGLNILAGLINDRLRRTALRAEGHQMRIVYHAIENGKPGPTLSNQATTDPFLVIFGLAGIVALVFALIWQHRAASAARALGFPAAHSPGWGVGCWFVPVVNFWMPYQACRDCLPPGDPNRKLVLQWWLVAVGAEVLTWTATFTALFSSSVSLGISFPAAVLGLGLIGTAPRVVAAISSAHQAALINRV